MASFKLHFCYLLPTTSIPSTSERPITKQNKKEKKWKDQRFSFEISELKSLIKANFNSNNWSRNNFSFEGTTAPTGLSI